MLSAAAPNTSQRAAADRDPYSETISLQAIESGETEQADSYPRIASLTGPSSDDTAEMLETVRRMPASALDSRLPSVAFDQWLLVTLSGEVESVRPQFVDWTTTFCDDTRTLLPRPGTELCAAAILPLSSEKTAEVLIAIGNGSLGANGRTRWRQRQPSLRKIYIERLQNGSPIDSLVVPSLAALAEWARLPVDRWPSIDLDTAVTWRPIGPTPGDVVHFTCFVGNVGTRDSEHASIEILIGVDRNGDNVEIRRKWFRRVPAGGRVQFDLFVPLPEGRAIVVVNVDPGPGKMIAEPNGDNNETVVVVGFDEPQPLGEVRLPGLFLRGFDAVGIRDVRRAGIGKAGRPVRRYLSGCRNAVLSAALSELNQAQRWAPL